MSAQPTYPLIRGGRLTIPVTLERASFDWTGVNVQCQIRTKAGGELVYTFAPSVSYPAVGEAIVTLDTGDDDTSAWPIGTHVGEVRVAHVAQDFGPHPCGRFLVQVAERVTIPT